MENIEGHPPPTDRIPNDPNPTASQSQRPSNSRNVSVYSETLLQFSRADTDGHIVDITINVAGQAAMPQAVYRKLANLRNINLPINEADFTTIWRSLLLKRTQDIYEVEKRLRSDNYIRLNRNIAIPGPLADLLYALGSYHSTRLGIRYHLIPPVRGVQPQDWYAINAGMLARWEQTTLMLQDYFVMKEYPTMSDTTGKPLMLTAIDEVGPTRRIRSFTSETKPSDAYIRFLNDDVFGNGAIQFADCHLIMTDYLNVATIRSSYLDQCEIRRH